MGCPHAELMRDVQGCGSRPSSRRTRGAVRPRELGSRPFRALTRAPGVVRGAAALGLLSGTGSPGPQGTSPPPPGDDLSSSGNEGWESVLTNPDKYGWEVPDIETLPEDELDPYGKNEPKDYSDRYADAPWEQDEVSCFPSEYGPSERFVAPPDECWGGDCPVYGSDTDCQGPIVGRKRSVDVAAWSDTVKIYGCDDVLVETHIADVAVSMLQRAWALLNENKDIIEWLVCWISGQEDGEKEYGKLEKLLETGGSFLGASRHTRVQIRCRTEDDRGTLNLCEYPDTNTTATATDFFWEGPKITLCIDGIARFYRSHFEAFDEILTWASLYPDERSLESELNCVTFPVAAQLLHELWHLAGHDHKGRHGREHCSDNERIHNMLIWALVRRYRDTWGLPSVGSCCAWVDDSPDNLLWNRWGESYAAFTRCGPMSHGWL